MLALLNPQSKKQVIKLSGADNDDHIAVVIKWTIGGNRKTFYRSKMTFEHNLKEEEKTSVGDEVQFLKRCGWLRKDCIKKIKVRRSMVEDPFSSLGRQVMIPRKCDKQVLFLHIIVLEMWGRGFDVMMMPASLVSGEEWQGC
jgi:hypothetical protein